MDTKMDGRAGRAELIKPSVRAGGSKNQVKFE